MESYLIQLRPLSGLKSGLASHTVFGNICWQLRELNPPLFQKVYDSFSQGTPPFILSSIFPCIIKENIYFFPIPLFAPLNSKFVKNEAKDKHDKIRLIQNMKTFKKIQWVTLPILKLLLLQKSYDQLFTQTTFLQNLSDELPTEYISFRNFLFTKMEIKKIIPHYDKPTKFITQIDTQKNSINRFFNTTGKSGEIYYQTEWYFHPIFDLFLLCNTTEEGCSVLESVFKLIEDSGLGGKKSTGSGQIKYLGIKKYSELNTENGSKFCTLSRYIPATNEVQPLYYNLISLRPKSYGFSGNPWKAKLRMFGEGSIFQVKGAKNHFGKCPIVCRVDGIEIIQYGLAYPVFLGD